MFPGPEIVPTQLTARPFRAPGSRPSYGKEPSFCSAGAGLLRENHGRGQASSAGGSAGSPRAPPRCACTTAGPTVFLQDSQFLLPDFRSCCRLDNMCCLEAL